jgi:hypothetical protein
MTAGRPRIVDKRFCDNCNATSTYTDKKNLEHWYYHKGKKYCNKCNNKLFNNPKWHPITHSKRIFFKVKQKQVKENPRKGVCELCHRIGYTHIHHTEYDEKDLLAHTVELCPSCHMTESWRLGQLNRRGK